MARLNKLQKFLGFTEEYSLDLEFAVDRTDPAAPLYIRNQTMTVVHKEPAYLWPLQLILRQSYSYNEVKDFETVSLAMYLGFNTEMPEITSSIHDAAYTAVAKGVFPGKEVSEAISNHLKGHPLQN